MIKAFQAFRHLCLWYYSAGGGPWACSMLVLPAPRAPSLGAFGAMATTTWVSCTSVPPWLLLPQAAPLMPLAYFCLVPHVPFHPCVFNSLFGHRDCLNWLYPFEQGPSLSGGCGGHDSLPFPTSNPWKTIQGERDRPSVFQQLHPTPNMHSLTFHVLIRI